MPSILEVEARLKDLQPWRPAETEGDVVQTWIEWLDQALSSIDPKSTLYSRSVRSLQALCRRSARLPTSCKLSEDIFLVSPHSISSSALSDVFRGRMGGRDVAIKVLRVHADNRAQVAKSFHNEAVMWKSLKHPNLVPFLGTSTMFPVCLVSRWMPYGTVSAYLEAFPRQNRLKFVQDIVRGLQYMHSLDVVHGDLKSANVLVDEECNARLGDFGVSILMQHTGGMTGPTSVQGTLRWMSPELLSCDPLHDNDGNPTIASDMYSLAMVFYEIFSGLIPFEKIRKEYGVVAAVLGGVRPMRPTGVTAVGLQDSLWAIMERCWSADPSARPKLSEVAVSIERRSVTSNDLPKNAVFSFFVPWRGGGRVPPVAPIAPMIPPCHTISPDGRHVAVALRGGLIQVCTVGRKGATYARFPTFHPALHRMAFSADGCHLLTSYAIRHTASTYMRVWRRRGNTWTAVGRTLKISCSAIPAVYTSGQDPRILVLASHLGNGSSLRPYDAATGLSTGLSANGPSTCHEGGSDMTLCVSPDETLAAAGSAFEIVVYRIFPFSALRTLTLGALQLPCALPTIDPRTLTFCTDAVHFIADSAARDGRHWTCAWDADGGGLRATALARMPAHHGAMYSRDGGRVALRRCASVLVYDTDMGAPLSPPLVQDQRAYWAPAAAFVGAQGGYVLHVSARSGAVSLWCAESGRRAFEASAQGAVVGEVDEALVEDCYPALALEGSLPTG